MTTTIAGPIAGIAHAVSSDGLRLHVWEKRLEKPLAGGPTRVALLVHGATYGGHTVYDVQTPSRNASLMDYLAARGWDAFTMDVRGYGRSEKPQDGFSATTEAAVRDIGAVVEHICKARGVASVDLMGWSWGGSTTALYTERNPERVRRLVMYAGGAGAPGAAAVQAAGSVPLEPWVVSTRESVMARVEQDAAVADAQEAFIQSVLQWETRSPNGLRWERADGRQAPRPSPERITVPTLLIYGARDAAYQAESVAGFFARLNTTDKALAVVPGAGHFLIIQRPRMRLFAAAEKWFGESGRPQG